MPDLDAALTRLAALAKEATPGPWRTRPEDAAFIAAADPSVVKAFIRVVRLIDPRCATDTMRAALDALAALLTEHHAWCTRSGCEDTWGDRRHCICGVGECPVLTGGDA